MRLKHIGFIISVLAFAWACDNKEQEKAGAIEKIKARQPDSLKMNEADRLMYEAGMKTLDSFAMAEYRREEAAGVALERMNFVSDSLQKDLLKDTRIDFPGFVVVLHHFRGYVNEYEDKGEETEHPVPFFNSGEATVKEERVENHVLELSFRKETILAKKDTLHLGEDMDERIDNTLIEIIPKDSDDRFKVSFGYEAALDEVIDYSRHKREKWEKLSRNAKSFTTFTSPVTLPDSAAYFFRAQRDKHEDPHSEGRENWDEAYFKKEKAAVKEKYVMLDTGVTIPGEYDRYANLHKGKNLFNFWYRSYLFRIDRINKGKIVETRYLNIGIQYGC
jgi:hypothetical protein